MEISLPENNAAATGAIVQQRMDVLSRFEGMGRPKKNLSDQEKVDIAKAARGFESMFVHMMMKEMKSAMLGEKPDDSDKENFGADILQSYADMLLADDISKSGVGIGVAEKIYAQMTGGEKLSAITVDMSSSNIPVRGANITTVSENKLPADAILPAAVKKSHTPEHEIKQHFAGTFNERINRRLANYESIIAEASAKTGVPEHLIKAIITAESAGRADAKSPVGAKGLMQLMDGTAADLGVTNSYDPRQNIMGGTKYIQQMLKQFGGDIEKALAAYNAGPGNVRKYNGVPPFSETKSYIARVKKYNEMYKSNL